MSLRPQIASSYSNFSSVKYFGRHSFSPCGSHLSTLLLLSKIFPSYLVSLDLIPRQRCHVGTSEHLLSVSRTTETGDVSPTLFIVSWLGRLSRLLSAVVYGDYATYLQTLQYFMLGFFWGFICRIFVFICNSSQKHRFVGLQQIFSATRFAIRLKETS